MNSKYNKEIDVIWKENPNIPFMQSKDILTYGYEAAIKNHCTKNEPQKDVKFEHTDDLTITNAKEHIKNQKSKNRRNYICDNQVEGQLKIDTLNYVIKLMQSSRDFLGVYMTIKDKVDQLKNDYGL